MPVSIPGAQEPPESEPAATPVPETSARAEEEASPRRRIASIKSLVVTIAFVFLLVVAMLLDIPYLYIMAIALALLQPISFFVASRFAPRYAVTRRHPLSAVEGRPVSVTLEIAARGGLPQAAVSVLDTLPPALVRLGEAEAPLDWWDGASGALTYAVEPAVRGVHVLGPVKVDATDPLGLFFFDARIACPTELVVHPAPVVRREHTTGGEGRFGLRERDGAVRRGEGLEFHGVREYRPGDSPRRVHWRTSARRGTLAVVEFERAFQQDLMLALDLGEGTEHGEGRETTLEYAVKAAATLAHRILVDGGGVTLVSQEGTVAIRAGESDAEAARYRLFDALARARARSPLSLAQVLARVRIPEGAELVVLTSRFDPELTAVLDARVRAGARVRVLFFEPHSFGGPSAPSPAVSGASLRILKRSDSPWEEGGRRFAYHLREED